MRTEYNESGLPINDDSTHLHQFCERLEFFLTSGLRGKNVTTTLAKKMYSTVVALEDFA